ncbi:hypothetical protein IJG22_02225 [Candidatus Saccharibacteria bacterium]|nr:hypothetical protein [Candidatus Saccharibacteria bacterium]
MDNTLDSSVYQVPAFRERNGYAFAENRANLEVYQELNQIAEEIEQCRLKNC